MSFARIYAVKKRSCRWTYVPPLKWQKELIQEHQGEFTIYCTPPYPTLPLFISFYLTPPYPTPFYFTLPHSTLLHIILLCSPLSELACATTRTVLPAFISGSIFCVSSGIVLSMVSWRDSDTGMHSGSRSLGQIVESQVVEFSVMEFSTEWLSVVWYGVVIKCREKHYNQK